MRIWGIKHPKTENLTLKTWGFTGGRQGWVGSLLLLGLDLGIYGQVGTTKLLSPHATLQKKKKNLHKIQGFEAQNLKNSPQNLLGFQGGPIAPKFSSRFGTEWSHNPQILFGVTAPQIFLRVKEVPHTPHPPQILFGVRMIP